MGSGHARRVPRNGGVDREAAFRARVPQHRREPRPSRWSRAHPPRSPANSGSPSWQRTPARPFSPGHAAHTKSHHGRALSGQQSPCVTGDPWREAQRSPVPSSRPRHQVLRPIDEVFRSEGFSVIRTPIRAPRANAHTERFVGTIRRDCLDWILIRGRRHLEDVLQIYVDHYKPRRPHRALGLAAPDPRPHPPPTSPSPWHPSVAETVSEA